MSQFLFEAIVICVSGGSIGLILGYLSAEMISLMTPIKTVFSWEIVTVALVFCIAIGVFFGIYPARKAALLDPIEALRYE